MIHGDIEEALDLCGMQIHAEHAIGAGGCYQIGHQFGRDGSSAGILAILTSVSEVGDDGRDSLGRGSAKAVDVDQQLHEVGVDGIAGGLNDEAVPSSNILVDPDDQFAIREQFGGPPATVAARGTPP